MSESFPVLILLARPAAGKSEVIDYLRKIPLEKRRETFRLLSLDIIDDFPMLWTWFEEDALLKEMSHPPLHTDERGFFKAHYFWHLLIRKIELEYKKRLRDRKEYHREHTAVIEFSRGSEHGGFREALSYFSADLLKKSAILYINVSWEESLRKNRARANPEKPDSILEHSVPETTLEALYRESDWEDISGGKNRGYAECRGARIPFSVMENEDDVTTRGGKALEERLSQSLTALWELYSSSPSRG